MELILSAAKPHTAALESSASTSTLNASEQAAAEEEAAAAAAAAAAGGAAGGGWFGNTFQSLALRAGLNVSGARLLRCAHFMLAGKCSHSAFQMLANTQCLRLVCLFD